MWIGIRTGLLPVAAAFSLLVAVNSSHADEYASGERSKVAIGHYAKARALLVEALAEFEQGRRLAQPNLLLDPELWRLSVVSRAEDLNRVLDPKPKVTRSGARFKANSNLIRQIDQPYRPLSFGPKDSNTYGETQRASELEAMRARLKSEPEADAGIDETEALTFEENSKPESTLAPASEATLDSTASKIVSEDSQATGPVVSEGSEAVAPKAASENGFVAVEENFAAPVAKPESEKSTELAAPEEAGAEKIFERLERLEGSKETESAGEVRE